VAIGAFFGFLGPEEVPRLRRLGLVTDYVGLFAVEGGSVLGQVLVLRILYRTSSGLEPVAGISSVTTRTDARRRGVARTLLQEVHRREAAAGRRFALLWTSQSWFAHRLYESLGYRDVWTPPSAVRVLPRARGSRKDQLRPVAAGELSAVERLHTDVTREDPGFSARPRGTLRVLQAGGDLDLANLMVLGPRGSIRGYAVLGKAPGLRRCGEFVARPQASATLLDGLERRAAPGVLWMGNSPVRALRPELRSRGYLLRAEAEWRVLMARPLSGSRDPTVLRKELGVDRPTFRCMSLDRF